MTNNDKLLEEIRKRVIRTETRVMALGNRLGFDLKAEDEVLVVLSSKTVHLAVLDTAMSTIINRCRREGLHNCTVGVWFDGKQIAEVRA